MAHPDHEEGRVRRERIGVLPLSGGDGAAPSSDPSSPTQLGWILAIGVSFDGIRAVETVLRGLPTPFPGVVLVALHRAVGGQPATLLTRLTGLPVTEPADETALQRGHVYVAPGDRHLVVRDGRIGIEHSKRVKFSRPSIDVLFESVASVYGPHAIGVLLSGYGFDGIAGLQAIKGGGGTTIVQDPSDARAPHLPKAAVAADGFDMTLPLRDIGPAIGRLVSEAARRTTQPSGDIAAE